MNRKYLLSLLGLPSLVTAADLTKPIVPPDLVFEEKDGVVAIEAEHFSKQTETGKRAWYLTTRDSDPGITPDGDPSSIAGASGGAYLEILPDTRRTHGDKLIRGENFEDEPGKMAILSYKVHFNTPGKYWLWARAFSTTSEDNGLHFGIDGTWPDTAKKWQTVTKNQWHWKSAQRTNEVHVGVPGILTLDVPTAGEHTIEVSMREDGIALDKILLVNRKDYTPQGNGPEPEVRAGKMPAAFPSVPAGAAAAPEKKTAKAAASNKGRGHTVPATAFDADDAYYLDKGKWLAIHPDQHKTAEARTVSRIPAGTYHITLLAVGEHDGSSTFEVKVGDQLVGKHVAPLSTEIFDEGPKYWQTWKSVELGTDDIISVRSTIASADGKEWSRARWAGLTFTAANPKTAKALDALPKP